MESSGNRPPGETCGICVRPVPPDEMRSRYGAIVEELGQASELLGNGLDDTTRSFMGAIAAWRCDRCHRWICNTCVLPHMIKTRGRRMRHRECGGVFKAPDGPSWIGVIGQRAVPPGSWRARFGIPTT